MPCSRADLVRISGLTAPTVSSAIENFQRRGLVKFTGEGSPSGGRPPRILEFNSQYGYVFGADVGGSGVRLALADLSGMIIGRLTQRIANGGTPDEVAALITNGMERLLDEHPIANQKILELAVGAPGITDVGKGRVLSAPNLVDWRDVSFADLLRDKTGISTTIENDVNLGALGEGRCGVARQAHNFVFIAIGSGVGAGIVIDGKLFHGANWSAGEVGYMQVPGLPSQDLAVKRLGVLESAIGGEGIKNAWLATANGRSNGAQSLRPTEVFDLAAAGNVHAQRILNSTAGHLALAIVNMSLILDTSLVVLGGGIGSHPALVEVTRKALARNEFANPEVVASNLGHDAQLHGAIWLAIQSAEHHGFRRHAGRRANVRRRIRSRIG
jgi:glucokinase